MSTLRKKAGAKKNTDNQVAAWFNLSVVTKSGEEIPLRVGLPVFADRLEKSQILAHLVNLAQETGVKEDLTLTGELRVNIPAETQDFDGFEF